MDKTDLITIQNYDVITFWNCFKELSSDEKSLVAQQAIDTFKEHNTVYFSPGRGYISDESFDYYIGLCEKVMLTGEYMDYIFMHNDILSKKGFFDGRQSNDDMLVNGANRLIGDIGKELRWLEKNHTHKDFQHRKELTHNCVNALKEATMKCMEDMDSLMEERNSDTHVKDRINTMLMSCLMYYASAVFKLAYIDELAKTDANKTGNRSEKSTAAVKKSIEKPFIIFSRLNNMSADKKAEIKQAATDNIKADAFELRELLKKGGRPNTVKCDRYVDNIEAFMLVNDTPMFDSPAVTALGALLEVAGSGKTLYGSLRNRINLVKNTDNPKNDVPGLSDSVISLVFALFGVVLCAFLLFNPTVKAFFRGSFFYTASYIICAVIGIGILIYFGFVAFIAFAVAGAFIFGNLEDIIGIGVAVKWIIIIAIAAFAIFCLYLAADSFIKHNKGKHMDLTSLKTEEEEQLSICRAYVKKCKTHISGFEENLNRAYKSGVCPEDRYEFIKMCLSFVNVYYEKAESEISQDRF